MIWVGVAETCCKKRVYGAGLILKSFVNTVTKCRRPQQEAWLVATRQQLQKVGGEVVLVGLSERGIRILKMSKLSKVFRHFATVDQAVTAFDDRHLCTAA